MASDYGCPNYIMAKSLNLYEKEEKNVCNNKLIVVQILMAVAALCIAYIT